tara:strand:- start:346 stop:705 length:360 start_codon:yes stop_codon:yes gene_type:complete
VIIIAGTIDFQDKDTRDFAVEQSLPLQESTRTEEPGCDAYYFGPDPGRDDRIQIFELWADEGSLEDHFKHPNYQAMLGLIGKLGMVATETAKYRCDLSEPIYDETFTPRADFFTDAGNQ